MGKQAKLKAARRQRRFLNNFMLDVRATTDKHPTLKKLFTAVVELKKNNAPDAEINEATRAFSEEFIKVKGIGGTAK